MFKVQKTEYTNKTFRMPTELVKNMELLAQNKGVSLNNLVIQCCEYALANLEQTSSDDENDNH
jgi:predicted HicB family RNase H-like nuclease